MRSKGTIRSAKNGVYTGESDLFAAYPLWIDTQSVESELNFSATQNGQYVAAAPGTETPVPQRIVQNVATPSPTLDVTQDELRQDSRYRRGELTGLPVYGRNLAGAVRHGIICDAGPTLATPSL